MAGGGDEDSTQLRPSGEFQKKGKFQSCLSVARPDTEWLSADSALKWA